MPPAPENRSTTAHGSRVPGTVTSRRRYPETTVARVSRRGMLRGALLDVQQRLGLGPAEDDVVRGRAADPHQQLGLAVAVLLALGHVTGAHGQLGPAAAARPRRGERAQDVVAVAPAPGFVGLGAVPVE